MKIKKLQYKNFASYGNRIQEIVFDLDISELYLVLGGNGAGKCLDKSTKINVEIEDNKLKQEYLKFLKNKKSIGT